MRNIFFEEDSILKESVINLIDKFTNNSSINLKTSGTTGNPKDITKNIENILNKKKVYNTSEKWILTFDPKRYAAVSVIAHIIKNKCELFVPKTLSYKDIIHSAFINKVTHISSTPSFFRNILLHDVENIFKKVPFKQITFGGEAATQGILDLTKKLFPEANITHVYASTEFGDICSVSDGLEGIPKYKFEKENFSFKEKELFINGISTEDLWELKENRYFFLGRIQEIINVGGIKVNPHYIEKAAINCGVEIARAYKIKNPILGFLIGLDYVGDIEPENLKILLKEKLTKYEMPSKIKKVAIIEITDAGKIRRL